MAVSRSKRLHLSRRSYFGQPPNGFFFLNDLVTAFSQSPLIFKRAGFGPGATRFTADAGAFVFFCISAFNLQVSFVMLCYQLRLSSLV